MVTALRNAGHDVFSILEDARGSTDESIALQSVMERRVLLTYDKDFGELLFASAPHQLGFVRKPVGIVLLRLEGMPYTERNSRVVSVFDTDEVTLEGHFTVIEPGRIRQRVLPGAPPNQST